MELIKLNFNSGFDVVKSTERSQAAVMTLKPEGKTGGPENKHENSDQWLYVVSGVGTAIINGETKELHEGDLLLIEAGETHEIKNSGDIPFQTLNFYAPKAY